MFNTSKLQSIIVIAIALFFTITTAHADLPAIPSMGIDLRTGVSTKSLPDYYPASFQSAGRIHRVSSDSIIITGSSKAFSLSPNILIHSMSTEFASRHELRVGEEIGYSFNTGMNNRRTVTEIWLLPRGSLPML